MKVQENKKSHKKKKPPEEKTLPEEKKPVEDTETELKVPMTHQMISKRLRQIHEEMIKITKKNAETAKEFKDADERAYFALDRVRNMIDNFEDSMMHILHNIKKNQFLYAHYPDEWAKNYQALKEGIKDENKFMDEKAMSQGTDFSDLY